MNGEKVSKKNGWIETSCQSSFYCTTTLVNIRQSVEVYFVQGLTVELLYSLVTVLTLYFLWRSSVLCLLLPVMLLTPEICPVKLFPASFTCSWGKKHTASLVSCEKGLKTSQSTLLTIQALLHQLLCLPDFLPWRNPRDLAKPTQLPREVFLNIISQMNQIFVSSLMVSMMYVCTFGVQN